MNPITRAWRRYKLDRWKGAPVDPDHYRAIRKAFAAGYKAARKEKEDEAPSPERVPDRRG